MALELEAKGYDEVKKNLILRNETRKITNSTTYY